MVLKPFQLGFQKIYIKQFIMKDWADIQNIGFYCRWVYFLNEAVFSGSLTVAHISNFSRIESRFLVIFIK